MEFQQEETNSTTSKCVPTNTTSSNVASSSIDDQRDAIICYVFVTNKAYFPNLLGADPVSRAEGFAKRIDQVNSTNNPERSNYNSRKIIKTPSKFNHSPENIGDCTGYRKRRQQ